MITIDNKYNIGDTVYLVTDVDGLPRMVTAILVTKVDCMYELSCGPQVSRHYDFEIETDEEEELNN